MVRLLIAILLLTFERELLVFSSAAAADDGCDGILGTSGADGRFV